MRKTALTIACLLLIMACKGPEATTPPTATLAVPPTLAPTPTPETNLPDATAAFFLDSWMRSDYAAMHSLLSPASRASVDAESFAQIYRSTLIEASVLTVTTRLKSSLREGDRAWAAFDLQLDTALAGTFITDTVMSLSLHGDRWGVDWDPSLIWPQLGPDRFFRMEYTVPLRANIYDRNGLGLAREGTIVTVGVIPGDVEDNEAVVAALREITDLSADEILARYVNAPATWKIPIADISSDVSIERNDVLAATAGIYREEKPGRIYPHGGAAPHVVGWVAPVPAEQLDAYRARGYRGDEWVGIYGFEAWGEEILAGKHGGRLTLVTGDGTFVELLSESSPVPGRAIYLTIDRDFQEQVQQIIGKRKGAIVVLDANTGAILALASGPGFDSNVFTGPAGEVGRSQILSDSRRPLINRALHGTYPLGSVFKIVTIAAAMEEAHMDPDGTSFFCPGYWDGLGEAARKGCWEEDGHGDITLKDALTASCDVTFYEVGLTLDGVGEDILAEYARGFGLGELTGLVGLPEDSGLVPDYEWKVNNVGEPWWVGDSVNLSIGQGYLLVTPLQVARMMAAVANGGTLLRPYIIDHIGSSANGEPVDTWEPEVVGTIPVSPGHLAAIQQALLGVTTMEIGTAPHRFAGLTIPVAGKTGTAESGGPESLPHSWFGAYAPANAPEIAIVVIVEQIGEGSTYAAPMVRQVVEAYYGMALTPLPEVAREGYVPPTPVPTEATDAVTGTLPPAQ
jgi:penicillin-binding protein 2